MGLRDHLWPWSSFRNYDKQIAEAEKTAETNHDTISGLEGTISGLEGQVGTQQTTLDANRREIESLRTQNDTLRQERDGHLAAATRAQQEANRLSSYHDEEMGRVAQEHQAAYALLESEKAAAESRKQELDGQVVELISRNLGLERGIQELADRPDTNAAIVQAQAEVFSDPTQRIGDVTTASSFAAYMQHKKLRVLYLARSVANSDRVQQRIRQQFPEHSPSLEISIMLSDDSHLQRPGRAYDIVVSQHPISVPALVRHGRMHPSIAAEDPIQVRSDHQAVKAIMEAATQIYVKETVTHD